MDTLEERFRHSAARQDRPSEYLIRKAVRRQNFDDLTAAMASRTIYVGKLSHFTTEEQIYELFSKCGAIDKIIMGLDRNKLTPCGFCFVVYREQQGSLDAMKYLNHTCLDGQYVSIDLDPGFKEGRQYGRGIFGGQAGQEASMDRRGFRGRGPPRGGFRGGRGFRGRGRGFRGRGNF
ncbi:hypothetical protein DIURU_000904 [Diutina rugosa]|uniref:Nuclear cap-binding protein subunit 2 n=1 Tax=Diutina rugosa TaxID=5481 RepID=A0A642UWG6_DIURU|nr:uncharacterized protein DIURU_000904 [Diutina rugosa]KAA8906743.1 hypothetical protein DIURU_000904 [Diutina rugosa]